MSSYLDAAIFDMEKVEAIPEALWLYQAGQKLPISRRCD